MALLQSSSSLSGVENPIPVSAALGSTVMTDAEIVRRLEEDCRDVDAWSTLMETRLPGIAVQKVRGESDLRKRVVSRAAAKIFVRFRNREDRGQTHPIDFATAYLCTCVVSALVEILRAPSQPPDSPAPATARIPERPLSSAERQKIINAVCSVADKALDAVRAQGRTNHDIAAALQRREEIDRSFPPFEVLCRVLKWTDPDKTRAYRERWRRFLKVYFKHVVLLSGLESGDIIAALVPPDELEESWLKP